MKTVRTRFAPSPTGYAHLGFVSRVLINYALARKHGGQFIWRNEDTDRERFVPDALAFNMHWMKEFGLTWDEGPDIGGPYAPYNQTERINLYKQAWEKLIANDYAYRCFCTRERLAELREIQTLSHQQTRYDGKCRNLTKEEIAANLEQGLPFTVRIKVPKNRRIEFDDLITHNHVVWESNEVDDYILVKSDGIPTYHLAAMYDDILMKITHIFRGVEWLATTPVHMLIFEGLGIKPEDRPQIGHFTVILDPNTPGKKMSKRNNSFRINGLIIQGYLKSAILNYLMLLGWAPKDNREFFTLEEFIETFDLAGMQKANPTWDQKKMDWFNGSYLRKLTIEEYEEEFLNWISNYLAHEPEQDLIDNLVGEAVNQVKDKDVMRMLVELAVTLKSGSDLRNQLALVQERAVSFWHALQQIRFFYNIPAKVNWQIKQLKNVESKIKPILEEMLKMFDNFSDDPDKWKHEDWEQGIRKIADEQSVKAGDAFMVLRVAIVGDPFSPPLFEAMQLLGKQESTARISQSLK